MMLSSKRVHMVEQAPKNSCHQCHVPRVSSSCLLPVWEALHDEKVGLTQDPFKLLLLPWILEHVRFLCFPQPSVSPKVSPSGLQSQTFWGLVFLVKHP